MVHDEASMKGRFMSGDGLIQHLVDDKFARSSTMTATFRHIARSCTIQFFLLQDDIIDAPAAELDPGPCE
jgi:hypothetical protein